MTLDGTEITIDCPDGRYTNAEVKRQIIIFNYSRYFRFFHSLSLFSYLFPFFLHNPQELLKLLYQQKRIPEEDGQLFGLWVVSASLRKFSARKE